MTDIQAISRRFHLDGGEDVRAVVRYRHPRRAVRLAKTDGRGEQRVWSLTTVTL